MSSDKSPDYDRVYSRACGVFNAQPFAATSLAIELKIRNDDLRAALEALVADGMLKVVDGLYQVSKYAKEN